MYKDEANIIVSVIVPVYNVELYLKECVDSIINQSFDNIEIILVDDGSTDNSSNICDEYSKIDERVKVIHKSNGGLSSARNVGINEAKGKYIMFVDSDDVISKTMIMEHVEVIKKYNYKIVASMFAYSLNKLESGGNYKVIERDKTDVLNSIFKEREISTSACGKIYDGSLWDGIRFPEGLIYEDYATIYKVVMKCDRIGFINKPYYYYRYNRDSITGQTFSDKKMDYYKVTSLIKEELSETKWNRCISSINNRTTRYSISFYREISRSGYMNEENCDYIIKYIKKNIIKYLFTKYKLSSKMYGILISISPKLARKVFEPRRIKGKNRVN